MNSETERLAKGQTPDDAGPGEGRYNQLTVASYEHCAIDYALSTAPKSQNGERPLLQRLLDAMHGSKTVLEIGSGPGWEADWLEVAGLSVRRTDATEAFLAFQRQRGKAAEHLDIVRDPVPGTYDAILALYVFQHIDRQALPAVLGKVAVAIRPGGLLLFSILEGEGEEIENGSDGGQYYTARWRQDALEHLLATMGLQLSWFSISEDSEGRWLTLLFRRPAPGHSGRTSASP